MIVYVPLDLKDPQHVSIFQFITKGVGCVVSVDDDRCRTEQPMPVVEPQQEQVAEEVQPEQPVDLTPEPVSIEEIKRLYQIALAEKTGAESAMKSFLERVGVKSVRELEPHQLVELQKLLESLANIPF